MKVAPVSEGNFSLSKVDFKGRGLKCHYSTEGTGEEEGAITHLVEECPFLPHQDVRDTQKALKVYVAKIFGYHEVLKNEKSIESKKLLECITVTKVHMKGAFDSQGVVISAEFVTGKKKKMAMNTPLIQLNQDIYGFEGEITTLLDTLVEQVYDYLFEGRRSKEDDLFSNTSANEAGALNTEEKAVA